MPGSAPRGRRPRLRTGSARARGSIWWRATPAAARSPGGNPRRCPRSGAWLYRIASEVGGGAAAARTAIRICCWPVHRHGPGKRSVDHGVVSGGIIPGNATVQRACPAEAEAALECVGVPDESRDRSLGSDDRPPRRVAACSFAGPPTSFDAAHSRAWTSAVSQAPWPIGPRTAPTRCQQRTLPRDGWNAETCQAFATPDVTKALRARVQAQNTGAPTAAEGGVIALKPRYR